MKILFTGASSFTGMWFVKELAKAGHEVTCTFLRPKEAYSDLRKKRIDEIIKLCEPVFDCPFGSDKFCGVISKGQHWDILCQHAADVNNYKSPDFNVVSALEKNTHNLNQVLKLLKEKGCTRVLLTGSVFEQNEGKGSDELRAVSPYGLSKGLTYETFRYFTTILGMKLGKFVIPNPFGPYEEARFTAHLMNCWFAGKKATVTYPKNVRDNIHVSLLAKAYVHFANELTPAPGLQKFNPCGYQESQGDFSYRFASEMEKRLHIPCQIEITEQKDYTEPLIRLNTDSLEHLNLEWNEEAAWDELAQYYKTTLKPCP